MGQIIITCPLDKAIITNVANTFPPVQTDCQTKKPSIGYFIFHGEIVLQPVSYAEKMFAAKMLQQTWLWQKKLMAKIPGTVLDMCAPFYTEL